MILNNKLSQVIITLSEIRFYSTLNKSTQLYSNNNNIDTNNSTSTLPKSKHDANKPRTWNDLLMKYNADIKARKEARKNYFKNQHKMKLENSNSMVTNNHSNNNNNNKFNNNNYNNNTNKFSNNSNAYTNYNKNKNTNNSNNYVKRDYNKYNNTEIKFNNNNNKSYQGYVNNNNSNKYQGSKYNNQYNNVNPYLNKKNNRYTDSYNKNYNSHTSRQNNNYNRNKFNNKTEFSNKLNIKPNRINKNLTQINISKPKDTFKSTSYYKQYIENKNSGNNKQVFFNENNNISNNNNKFSNNYKKYSNNNFIKPKFNNSNRYETTITNKKPRKLIKLYNKYKKQLKNNIKVNNKSVYNRPTGILKNVLRRKKIIRNSIKRALLKKNAFRYGILKSTNKALKYNRKYRKIKRVIIRTNQNKVIKRVRIKPRKVKSSIKQMLLNISRKEFNKQIRRTGKANNLENFSEWWKEYSKIINKASRAYLKIKENLQSNKVKGVLAKFIHKLVRKQRRAIKDINISKINKLTRLRNAIQRVKQLKYLFKINKRQVDKRNEKFVYQGQSQSEINKELKSIRKNYRLRVIRERKLTSQQRRKIRKLLKKAFRASKNIIKLKRIKIRNLRRLKARIRAIRSIRKKYRRHYKVIRKRKFKKLKAKKSKILYIKARKNKIKYGAPVKENTLIHALLKVLKTQEYAKYLIRNEIIQVNGKVTKLTNYKVYKNDIIKINTNQVVYRQAPRKNIILNRNINTFINI